jgi:hypothetical protein
MGSPVLGAILLQTAVLVYYHNLQHDEGGNYMAETETETTKNPIS